MEKSNLKNLLSNLIDKTTVQKHDQVFAYNKLIQSIHEAVEDSIEFKPGKCRNIPVQTILVQGIK